MSTAELRAHFVSNMGKMLLLDLICTIHGETPNETGGDRTASLSLAALRYMVPHPSLELYSTPLSLLS